MTSNFEDVQSDPTSASVVMLIPSAKAGPAMGGGEGLWPSAAVLNVNQVTA